MFELSASSTAEQAVTQIMNLTTSVGIPTNDFDLRTLRLWRTKQQITVEGRKITRRNLLEVAYILKRRAEGLTHLAASSEALKLTEEELEANLSFEGSDSQQAVPGIHSGLSGQQTLIRLAQGIVDQFEATQRGQVVAYNEVLRPETLTPTRLQQAQAFLGRHYFEERTEDAASSLHRLLSDCTRPLELWAPRSLLTAENHQLKLIDPFYRIPSSECRDLAETGRGYTLLDFRQHYLHKQLRETVGSYGLQRDEMYTFIREFIGRNPLVNVSKLRKLQLGALRTDTLEWLSSLYEPVHASLANKLGLVASCSRCHSLLTTEGQCTLEGCMEQYKTREIERLEPLQDVLLARREVRKYWCDPAREELRIYDSLNTGTLAGQVHLYPCADLCDVSVGRHIAVDVKEHRDPVGLARTLNDSRSDLALYDIAILAISDRYWKTSKHYGERLMDRLNAANRKKWRVMGVSEAIRFIKSEVK